MIDTLGILIIFVIAFWLTGYGVGYSHGKKSAIREQMEYKAMHGCEDKMWQDAEGPVWNFKPRVLRPEPEFWRIYQGKAIINAANNNYKEDEY
jgi:hypothetical protein